LRWNAPPSQPHCNRVDGTKGSRKHASKAAGRGNWLKCCVRMSRAVAPWLPTATLSIPFRSPAAGRLDPRNAYSLMAMVARKLPRFCPQHQALESGNLLNRCYALKRVPGFESPSQPEDSKRPEMPENLHTSSIELRDGESVRIQLRGSILQKEFGVEREFAVQCEANSQQSEFRPVASRSEQGSTINRSGKKVMHRGV